MTRWKAAGLHLAISAVIGFSALLLLYFLWYPPPYFLAAGGGRLATILLGVDVVVGPLLTLLVYRQGKRGLRLDLSVIALLQLGALLYGLHTMWVSRPVYLVAVVDRFVLVAANNISEEALRQSPPQYANLPCCGPRMVGAVLPTDQTEREALMMSSVGGGPDVDALPRYYTAYRNVAQDLLERATPLDDLLRRKPEGKDAVAGMLGSSRSPDSVMTVPVATRERHVTMLLDATTGEPLGAVDIDPW